jgi:hypothetical protein
MNQKIRVYGLIAIAFAFVLGLMLIVGVPGWWSMVG